MPRIQRMIGENGYTPTVYATYNVANIAGGGAGASVTTSLATYYQDNYGTGTLPGDNGSGRYSVEVTPSQPAIASVTGKTSSGFSVTLYPYPPTATLAVGTFDIIVHS